MTARLLAPSGTVAHEWLTDRPDLAAQADRNYPPGWRVEILPPQQTGEKE